MLIKENLFLKYGIGVQHSDHIWGVPQLISGLKMKCEITTTQNNMKEANQDDICCT